MSAVNPIAIALTGLTAATARLTSSATNIANAQVPGYRPDTGAAAPLPADDFLALPNVDLATEMVTQMTALHAYRANLETIRAVDEMQTELLRVI